MKNTITLIAMVFTLTGTQAQDFITKQNGEDIKAKVLEVTQTEIKYKRFESLDGATYTINKSDVLMIRYQDGTKDMFSIQPVKKETKHKEPKANKRSGNYPTGYITGGAGAGLPTGEFSSISPTDQKAGFAKTGYAGFAEFAVPIARSNFGLAVNVGYYSNSINTVQLVIAEQQQNSGYLFNWSPASYTASVIIAGLYVTVPVKKFSFDFKALAGIAACTFPAQNIISINTNTSPPQNTYSSYASASAVSFAYGGNITIRYAIVKHFCILAQGGFFSASPNYSITTSDNNGNTISNSLLLPTIIINISAGLGFQF